MANVHQLYNEGEKLKDDGKIEEAVQKFEEVLALDEQFALAHFALAVMYGKLGQHEKAVQHGERACELDPDDPFSYTALSVTYQRAFAGTKNREYIRLAEEAMSKSHAMQMR